MHSHKKISGYLVQIDEALSMGGDYNNVITRGLLRGIHPTMTAAQVGEIVGWWIRGENGRIFPRLPAKWIDEGVRAITEYVFGRIGDFAMYHPDGDASEPEAVEALPESTPAPVLDDLFSAPAEPVVEQAEAPEAAPPAEGLFPALAEETALAEIEDEPTEIAVVVEPEIIGKIGRADIVKWVEGVEIIPGRFYAGMPNEVYHALPHASNSRLARLAKSPAHARYEPPRKQTSAMRMGSAIHASILEPHVFDREWLLMEDTEDRRKSEYKEASKHHDPEKILVGDEAAKVAAAQATIYADPNAGPLIEAPGWTELSAVSICPITGANIRFRFDKITEDRIGIDLKKTRDATEDEFSRSVANFRYHVQAALYSDQFFQLTGVSLRAWVFLAIEDDPPHAVRLYIPSDNALELGRTEYQADLAKWAECENTGSWPLPDASPAVIDLPAWYEKRARERLGLPPLKVGGNE